MINRNLVGDFANIIGNIQIAIKLDSYLDVKNKYEIILNELIEWVKNYYINKNLDEITYEKTLEIHTILKDIKWEILSNKKIGIEALLSDSILIRYEVIMKTINDERKK